MLDYDPAYGSLVVDSHDDMSPLFVVVNRPGVTCDNWEVDHGDSTVARDNPTYNMNEQVVIVVEYNTFNEFDSGWMSFSGTDYPLTKLAQNNIAYYAFPMSRLAPAPDELVVMHSSLPENLKTLTETLADAGFSCRNENNMLVCEKFGETYRIEPDGAVIGSGVLTDRLEALVDSAAVS